MECKSAYAGIEYVGEVNTTVSGRTCQRWDSQSPHSHNVTTATSGYNLTDMENYCRQDINVEDEDGGPWCYTTDPLVEWEYCDIPLCPGLCKYIDPTYMYIHVQV